MHCFLSDPESGLLNLEAHWITSYCKEPIRWETLQECPENHRQKPSSFQLGDRVYFKKKQTGKMWSKVETQIQDCSYWAWWTLPAHQKPGHGEDKVMQHKRCCTQITHWVLEHWHVIQQSWEVHQPPCQLTNHHAQQLNMNTWLM